METFPNPLKHSAAKALLFLKSFSFCEEESSFSSSTSSAVTTGSSAHASQRDPLVLLTIAAHNLEKKTKLQITRRARSKIFIVSAHPPGSSERAETWLVSSVSVNTPNAPIRPNVRFVRRGWICKKNVLVKTREQKIGGTRLRSRANDILKFLAAGGCFTEIQIRQVFGDSPDTSKALRMLIKLEEVKRSGAGGRGHPYLYEVAQPRSEVDSA